MTVQRDLGYPNNFFHTNEVIQKIAGMKFPGKEFSFIVNVLYLIYVLAFYGTGILFLVCEFLMFNETTKEISKLVSHIGMMMQHLSGLLKFYTLVFRRKQINRIMDILQDKKYHYEPIDMYRPGEMLAREKVVSSGFSILVFMLYSFAGVSAHITSLISINKGVKGYNFEGNTTCYDYLPYYFRNPFPSENKSECVWYAFMYMDIGLGVFAWMIACHDGVFVSLLNCLKTQLLILGDVFKTLRRRTLRKLNLSDDPRTIRDVIDSDIEHELYTQLTKCTEHLKALLKVRDDIEDIFTFITLSQTLASLLIFASCLYVASTVPMTSPEFFAQVEYFVCALVQFSLICWYGNEITTASASISRSLYESDWFRSSYRYKKSMLVTMIRMQRPVYLSIGKFTPLSLSTLVTVCRGSFSYFAVFKSIQ